MGTGMSARAPGRPDPRRVRASDHVPGQWRDFPQLGEWPFRQTVTTPADSDEALALRIEAAFRESGYAFDSRRPLADGVAGYRPRGGPLLMAERDIRAAPLSRPKRVASIVLLASGIGLGGVEAIVFGAPFLAVPWVLGSIGAALLFAIVLNRAYDSDVVVAVPLVGPRPSASGPASTAARPRSTVVFLGGQVRSEVFGRPSAGSRDAIAVTDEVHALRGMTAVAKAFESRGRAVPSGGATIPTAGSAPPPAA